MKKNLKFIILGVLMALLILGYYYYISNKNTVDDVEEMTTKVTVVDQLINAKLQKDYPPTPREVLKVYSDITVAFYTEEYSDEQFEKLALKIRELYDDELNLANPESSYLSALKNEIIDFKQQGVAFSSYALSSATDVDYFNVDGRKCARLEATFTVKQGTNIGLTTETFVLRKDDDGHWKIFGWTLSEKDNG